MFSIIIPVFNEEKRIPKSVGDVFDFFKKTGVPYEIIFVDDGSTDRTKEILLELEKKNECRVISYKENKGKGHAVKTGAREAKGDWIVFFDIDLATPLEEFNHLREFMKSDDKIIIGSRRVSGAKIAKGESAIRTFLGQGFTRLSNILVPKISDFTCGFKCFSKDSAEVIFKRARINRWGFDTELLYIAHLHNIPIRQMPVVWRHDEDSRVNVFKSVISSFRELCGMLINRILGLYN